MKNKVAKTIKDFFSSSSTKKLFEQGKASVQERGSGAFEEFDDGKYRCQLVAASISQSKTSGRWQHAMGFKFLEGEYKGKLKYQYQGLENEVGFSVLIADLARMGIEVEAVEDLESVDKKLMKEKPIVDIRLRTKGEFQNVSITKLVDEDEVENEDEEEEEEEENEKDEKSKAEDDDDSDDTDRDSDDESDDEDDEETKPSRKLSKKSSKKNDEDDEENEENDEEKVEEDDEAEDDSKVNLEIGTKVKVLYDDEKVIGTIVKLDEEDSKNQRIKVKLKNGDKVWIKVPDEIEGVLG